MDKHDFDAEQIIEERKTQNLIRLLRALKMENAGRFSVEDLSSIMHCEPHSNFGARQIERLAKKYGIT